MSKLRFKNGAVLFALIGSALAVGVSAQADTSTPPKIYQAKTKEVLADVLAQEIRKKDRQTEYGAFIYCEDTCWSSPIVEGTSTGIPSEVVYGVYDYSNVDNVAGFIHSHPRSLDYSYTVRYTLDFINKAPSTQDYLFMATLASEGLVTQPTTLYIVGPDTKLRGYDVPRPLK